MASFIARRDRKVVNIRGKQIEIVCLLSLAYQECNNCAYFGLDVSATHLNRGILHGKQASMGGIGEMVMVETYFPEFVKFLPLVTCNEFGQPLNALRNLMYHLNQRMPDEWVNEHYRCSGIDNVKALRKVARKNNDELFKRALYDLGIIKKWRDEAEECIAWIEEQYGHYFEHTPSPKFVI